MHGEPEHGSTNSFLLRVGVRIHKRLFDRHSRTECIAEVEGVH